MHTMIVDNYFCPDHVIADNGAHLIYSLYFGIDDTDHFIAFTL